MREGICLLRVFERGFMAGRGSEGEFEVYFIVLLEYPL